MSTNHQPTPNEIEARLRAFRPAPSDDFEQRMQTAPWHPAARTIRRPRGFNLGWRGALALTMVLTALVMRPAVDSWFNPTHTPTATATRTSTPTATHTESASAIATPLPQLGAVPLPTTPGTPPR